MLTPQQLASFIDQTLLKPDATEKQIEDFLKQALEYSFASSVINPIWVPMAVKFLKKSKIKVCSVVDFPLGASPTSIKLFQAESLLNDFADEIDMVANIGWIKAGEFKKTEKEISQIKKIAGKNKILKVIIECALLTQKEKIESAKLVKNSGADFVKTSTGIGYPGATIEDVKLLRKTVGRNFGVKASGGIRDLQTTLLMIQAGASRIGTSSGIKIIQELKQADSKKLQPKTKISSDKTNDSLSDNY